MCASKDSFIEYISENNSLLIYSLKMKSSAMCHLHNNNNLCYNDFDMNFYTAMKAADQRTHMKYSMTPTLTVNDFMYFKVT